MSDGSEDDAPAKVGYKRPPVEHRFKKGRSGNPRGRPKARPPRLVGGLQSNDLDIDAVILNEAKKPIRIIEDGKSVETTTIEALMKSLRASALKGDRPVQLQLARMVSTAQRRTQKKKEDYFVGMLEYRADAVEAMVKARSEGRPLPEAIPHPADMRFDPMTGRVIINGPSTREEQAEWHEGQALAAECQKKIDNLKDEIANGQEDHVDNPERIRALGKVVRRIHVWYPDEEFRRQPLFDLHEWQMQQPEFQAMQAELDDQERKKSRRRRKIAA